MTDSGVGQLVLLVTTIVGFVVTAWRENRNRRWASDDRAAATREIVEQAKAEAEALRIRAEAIADQVKIEAAVLAAVVKKESMAAAEVLRREAVRQAESTRANSVKEAAGIREEQRISIENLGDRIDAVGVAAVDAYKEANHVNIKIEDLNKRLLLQGEQQSVLTKETDTVLGQIDSRGADTNVRVRDIQQTQQNDLTSATTSKEKETP